ncbi:hypothetical protein HY031_03340 [Candidatus Gottesmanbacteria bacterium]|nr:hypothetical protein [Candidatus Gottesmanbacteria bacterium]
MAEASINLISPQKTETHPLGPIVGQLRTVSLVGLGMFIVSAVLVSVLYIIFHQQNVQLQAQRDRLRDQISANASTEGLLAALKSRVNIAGKLLTNQINWLDVLRRITQFAPAGNLGSISVDEKHRVVMTIKTGAIEDNLPILAAMVSSVGARQILAPQIVSFQLSSDGTTTLVVSFLPAL